MKKPRSIDRIIHDYHRAIDDLIDDYQRRLAEIPTWTKEKRQLVQELEESLKKAGFGYYHGNPADCGGPTGLGNDTVLVVPANKRGYLQYYRGQTVRLVCVGPGRYKRTYRVGPTAMSRVKVAAVRTLRFSEAIKPPASTSGCSKRTSSSLPFSGSRRTMAALSRPRFGHQFVHDGL